MAEGGEQYGEDGERERSMWIQQAARPNWFQAAVSGDGKGDGDGGKEEAEEDSGLELSLGLSLGSRSSGSKGKGGAVPKEEKGKDSFKPEPAGKVAGEGKEKLVPGGPGFESWRQQQQQQQLLQQQQQQSQPQASDEEMRMAMHHIAAMHAMQQQQQQQQGKEDAPAPFFQDLQQNAAAAMVINNAVVWARLAQAQQQQLAGSAPAAAPGSGMVLQPSGLSGSFLPLQRQQSGLGPEMAEAGLDPQQRQLLEQQRKNQAQAQRRQEARKKRKIQQEQKLQKKAKKEEEAPRGKPQQQLGRASTPPPLKTASSLPSNCKEVSSPPDSQEGAASASASASAGSAGSGGGFRRMGSGSWPAAVAGEQEEGGEQMQELKRALQIYGKERKEKEADAASSIHMQRLKAEEAVRPLPASEGAQGQGQGQGPSGVAIPVPAPGPAPGAPLNVIDFARLSQEGWFQKLMEMQMMNPGLPQTAVAFMQEHGVGPVPVSEHGQRRREPLERTSSVEHERAGSNVGENGGDRKGSPMRYDGRNVEKVSSLPTAAQYPSMPGMPGVPPGFPPANFMHMPYPFPIPIPPNAAGFPFPFPYLLQPGPAPGGGDVRPMPVTSGGPYQLLVTPPGFAPFLPSPEMGNPWPQVVRPQAAAVAPVAAVSPPRSIVRTASGMSEDDGGRNQGSKSSDKRRSRASSPSEEERGGNAARVGPPAGAVRPVGAFAPMRNGPVSGFSVPPQFGLPRNMSEGGERLLPREGSVGSAFASLSMTSEPIEVGEGKPPQQNKAPAQNGVKVERAQPRALGEGSAQEESAGSVVTQLETAGADASNADEMERAGAAAAQQPSSEGHNSASAAASAVTGNASANAAASAERGNPENISSKIAPGIAPGETFGGTGQIPALPWVQCTGAGPNGKTICGALYSCQKVIRIVCKCHGNHMSPADFVKHAGGADTSNPEKFITVSHYTLPTQAAIAHG